jgi:hypothetical protein
MAIHEFPADLAQEAIEEYLMVIRYCLNYKKKDGGCLGYPAALLSLCIVNALGTYLRGEAVGISGNPTTITKGEPFRVFNHKLFGLNLTNEQIKVIEHRYRNLLAHNAMLGAGSWLLPGTGPSSTPFVFKQGQVAIFVESLFDLVVNGWNGLDKTKIAAAIQKGFIKP